MKDIIIENYLLFTSLVGLLASLFSNRTLSRKTIRILN